MFQFWTIRNFGHVTVPGPGHVTVLGFISRDGICFIVVLLSTRDAWAIIDVNAIICLYMAVWKPHQIRGLQTPSVTES